MSITGQRKLAYVVMVFSLAIVIKLARDIIRIKATDKRLAVAQQELAAAKNEQVELKQQLSLINQNNWWEKQVRNVLNMAKPGEVIVVVPDEVAKVRQSPDLVRPEETKAVSNLQKWREVFNF